MNEPTSSLREIVTEAVAMFDIFLSRLPPAADEPERRQFILKQLPTIAAAVAGVAPHLPPETASLDSESHAAVQQYIARLHELKPVLEQIQMELTQYSGELRLQWQRLQAATEWAGSLKQTR
jgi:hypothetical protein